MYQEVKY